MSDELEKYFRDWLKKDSRFDVEKEKYLLLDVLNDSRAADIIYPQGETYTPTNRDAIMHLYLWDVNFYNKDEDSSNPSVICRQTHDYWWSDNKRKIIKKCIDDGPEDLSNLIFNIIKHWEFLRDDLFKKDHEELEECSQLEEYKEYILNHPNTYPEYILQAKYEIAELSGCAFEELQTALTEYPNSEWVKDLKKRCRTTSLHIPYTFSRILNDKPKIQTIIEEFIESFVELSIDDNVPSDNKHFYITDCLVSEKLWNAVTGIRHQVLRKNLDVEKMMTREELKGFILGIQRLTWIRLRPPTKQEWLEYTIYQSKRTEKPISPSESYRSHPACHTWQWCIPSLDKNEGSFVTTSGCTEIYPVPFGCYAACQLVLDV